MEKEISLQHRDEHLVMREVYLPLTGIVNALREKDLDNFLDDFPDFRDGHIENEDCEEEYIEIFEYWAVSHWLGKELKLLGEHVEQNFYGLCVWGRTCSGQHISMDSVMRKIVQKFGYPGKFS